jgi:peptidoglycan/LPS O-acetylase OafA/YrhL
LWIGLGAVFLIGAGADGGNEGWTVLVTYPLAAAASVTIIFGALGARLRAGAYLGKISYGLYVFHTAAIRVVPSTILALPLTIAIAALSYRYLESPFLRLKGRFARL